VGSTDVNRDGNAAIATKMAISTRETMNSGLRRRLRHASDHRLRDRSRVGAASDGGAVGDAGSLTSSPAEPPRAADRRSAGLPTGGLLIADPRVKHCVEQIDG